jgi:hypothetical protein
VAGYGLEDYGSVPTGSWIFLFAISSSHFSIQWIPDILPVRVKLLDLEAAHSPSSSAKVSNAWSFYLSVPCMTKSISVLASV